MQEQKSPAEQKTSCTLIQRVSEPITAPQTNDKSNQYQLVSRDEFQPDI